MSDPYNRFPSDELEPRERQRLRKILQDQADREAYARGGERLKTIAMWLGSALAVIAFTNQVFPGALGRLFG